jgi:XFP N-terminal domain
MNRYRTAPNYLCVGQIYLSDNPLLREPLTGAQIKPRLMDTGAHPLVRISLPPLESADQGTQRECESATWWAIVELISSRPYAPKNLQPDDLRALKLLSQLPDGCHGHSHQVFRPGVQRAAAVINPLGSALVFLGLVGGAPTSVVRTLSRQIALRTVLFLVIPGAGHGAAGLLWYLPAGGAGRRRAGARGHGLGPAERA